VVEPIAVRVHHKELICWLPQRDSWAWVHLTGTSETDPRWPNTQIEARWTTLVDLLREADRG
jgi:hypothetical protein